MPTLINPDTFGFLVNDVARLLRAELDRRITDSGLGLTAGEGRTLLHAARAGAVRQAVLAERMGLEPMTISDYLDRLEAKQFVVRRPDPCDRRAKLVQLTEAADEAVLRLAAIGASIREDIARDIPPDTWEAAQAALKMARERLSTARAEHREASPK